MSCTVNKLSIVTLMGLPGSGKTTLANKIKEYFKDCPETICVILHYDEFIPLEVQAKFVSQPNLAKTLRKNFISCVHIVAASLLNKAENVSLDAMTDNVDDIIPHETLKQKALQILSDLPTESGQYENAFVIVDDNNYYKSMRNDFYQVAKSLECSFCLLYLQCTVKQSKERNLNRPPESQVTAEAIEEMSARLEEPDPMSNSSDLFCIQYPTSTDVSEEIDASVKTLLTHSLLNPVIYTPPPDRSEDKRICSENEVHQADLVLRKWINSQMVVSSFTTNKTPGSRKSYSEELNSRKGQVLQKLRTGEYKILAQVSQDVEFRSEIVSLVKHESVSKS